jgi:transducin (beta)-like 1
MNGDMMDVDVGGMGQTSMIDPTVAEAESPRPVTEEPFEPTLSIGQSQEVATEAPRDLNPDTSFLPAHEGTTLEFVKWCPDNSTALLVAGENHMRAYRIASEVAEEQSESKYSNIPVDEEEYRVQAFCWTEKSSAVFSTAREYANEIGDSIPQNRLFGFTNYGNGMQLVDPLAGTIVALRYNPSSNLLLSISHGEQAVIKIWKYSQVEPENGKKLKEANFEFVLDKIVGAEIYDAAWTTDNKFLVCGMNTLQLYEVGEDINLVKAFGTEQDWFRMQYDPLCEVAALSDDEMHALGVVKLDGDLKIHNETFQNTTLTDFAFQPILNKESYQEGSPRLLATSSANGQVRIWNALGPLVCLHELSLGMQAAAMVVSFSPDGFLLAAAGYDTLHVWKTDEGGEPKAVWHMPAPNDRWDSVPQEEPEEKEPLAWLHTLSWDSDGKKLAFGLKDQVAVIRLRQTESER